MAIITQNPSNYIRCNVKKGTLTKKAFSDTVNIDRKTGTVGTTSW